MQQLNLSVFSDKIDAMASRRCAGGLILERSIGDLPGLAVPEQPGPFSDRPNLVVLIVAGLKDKILAIGGPASAAFRGGLAPSGQQRMKIAALGGHLPELGGLALGVAEGEAQTLPIRRPTQPKGQAGGGNQFVGVAAISAHNRQFVAAGNQQTAAVGHPCGIMSQHVRNPAGIAAECGNNPQGLFWLGLQVAVNDQLGAVRSERADQRSANLRRQMNEADLAIGGQRNRQLQVAVVHLREVEPRAVAGRAGEALHFRIIGQYMAGIGDLLHPIRRAGGRAKKQSQPQRQAYARQRRRNPAPADDAGRSRPEVCAGQERFGELGGGLHGRLRFQRLDRSDEPVAALGQRLHKTRVLGAVAQSFAQLIDGDAQAVVKVNSGLRAPEQLLQRFVSDNLAGMFEKRRQQLEGLALQPDMHTGTAQFATVQIGFKNTELHQFDTVVVLFRCHECPTNPRLVVYRRG